MRLPSTTAIRPERIPAQPRVVAPRASTVPVLGARVQPSKIFGIPSICETACGVLPEPAASLCKQAC